MKKFSFQQSINKLLFVCFLIVGVIGSTILLKKTFSGKENKVQTTTSPDGKYYLQILEEVLPSKSPFFQDHGDQTVTMIVKNRSNDAIYKESIYEGDGYDDNFFTIYPETIWISNNIISFNRKDALDRDIININNDTDQQFQYLIVNISKDQKIVLFDIPPKSLIKINTISQNKSIWISCFGKFANGKTVLGERGLEPSTRTDTLNGLPIIRKVDIENDIIKIN